MRRRIVKIEDGGRDGGKGDFKDVSVFICVVINRGQQGNTTNLEEIIWSSSCDVRFTATWSRIELEAGKRQENRQKLFRIQFRFKTYNENFKESSNSINAA